MLVKNCQNKVLSEISIEPFSSYNVAILIFQKIANKYNKTFNKNIYKLIKFINSFTHLKLIKCRAKFLSRNILFQ